MWSDWYLQSDQILRCDRYLQRNQYLQCDWYLQSDWYLWSDQYLWCDWYLWSGWYLWIGWYLRSDRYLWSDWYLRSGSSWYLRIGSEIGSNNRLSNYGQTLSRGVHTMCVSNKKFLTISIHSLCSSFAKTKRGCHEKNDIFQSHHFYKITTKQEKMSKTSCKLFTTSNHDTRDTRNENRDVAISCRDP